MFVRLCHLVKFRFKVWSRAHKYSVPSLNFEVQSWPSLPLTFTLKRRRAADKLWAHLAIFNLKSPQIMKLWKNSAMNLPFLTGLDSRSSYFCPFTPTSTLLSTNPSTRLSSFNEIPLTIANWHEKISLPQRPLSSFYEFSRIDLMWIWGLPRALYDKNIWKYFIFREYSLRTVHSQLNVSIQFEEKCNKSFRSLTKTHVWINCYT